VGIHQNITQRKQAEARDRLLVSALEAVGLGVVIADINSCIIWVNSAFEKLSGYSFAEALGRKPAELVKSGLQNDEFYQAMWSKINQGETWQGELINRRKNGELYYEELSITPVMDEKKMISHYVSVKRDISDRKRIQEQLWSMATIDELTGLINRRYFMVKIAEEFERVRGIIEYSVAVLMLDLDYFKRINDTYGHSVGDEVLKHFAAFTESRLRKTDIAGRLGGEEFAIVLPNTHAREAKLFAGQFCQQLSHNPWQKEEFCLSVTVSIGIAMIDFEDTDYGQALIRADKALYQAKENGRNRAVFYVPMNLNAMIVGN
jgi:diguanylate cyclase (GGDEF)-like protein/PAS domain S-box-containing protein